jgi:hypothetical protein
MYHKYPYLEKIPMVPQLDQPRLWLRPVLKAIGTKVVADGISQRCGPMWNHQEKLGYKQQEW